MSHRISAAPVQEQPAQHRRSVRSVVLPVVLVLLGVLVLMYPVVATQWNNYRQAEVAQQYAALESESEPSELEKAAESARRYNRERADGPILDPWLARVSQDNPDYQAYLQELDTHEVMARLVVPAGNVDLPVYHGTSDEVLHKGVGHLFGTDLPVGGEGVHSVMTAHTGLTNATLFDNLKDVKAGDAIYVQVSGEKLKYEVHETQVVLPDETDSLASVAGQDLLTLITCTPYGVNTHRLLVHAHRVPIDGDEQAFEESGLQWQWWMWAFVVAVAVVLALLVFWVIRQIRKSRVTGEAHV